MFNTKAKKVNTREELPYGKFWRLKPWRSKAMAR